ncbi:cupin [Tropicimonas sp. IMCC6043]|uniref:cupin n=1 Tax=Tropicimonas sp. IMCC6043 TaxID=2510645 RepID=UPI00101C4B6F|nr:cupin [Tropicimonas sp. IMCC6043]RYH11534.1 cupin [Tropicimonas sp. IMCC6043]
MMIHELYADPDGESRWRDVEVTLEERVFAPPAKGIEVSAPQPASQTVFLRLRSGWDEPIHPTPVAQRLVCLSGSVRVTASDGTFRDIDPGDVWDMSDTHGKGHHTAVTSAEDFECVIVQFA